MGLFPKRGSLYWFDPEPVKGAEIRKIRPCAVISPDEMNEHLKTVIIAPITSTIQPWPFRCTINVLDHPSSVACDQVRTIDRSRLKGHIGALKPRERRALFGILQAMLAEQ